MLPLDAIRSIATKHLLLEHMGCLPRSALVTVLARHCAIS